MAEKEAQRPTTIVLIDQGCSVMEDRDIQESSKCNKPCSMFTENPTEETDLLFWVVVSVSLLVNAFATYTILYDSGTLNGVPATWLPRLLTSQCILVLLLYILMELQEMHTRCVECHFVLHCTAILAFLTRVVFQLHCTFTSFYIVYILLGDCHRGSSFWPLTTLLLFVVASPILLQLQCRRREEIGKEQVDTSKEASLLIQS